MLRLALLPLVAILGQNASCTGAGPLYCDTLAASFSFLNTTCPLGSTVTSCPVSVLKNE